MIVRVWHGWTPPERADAYEELLREEIATGFAGREIPGYLGLRILREARGNEVEFLILTSFESLDSVRGFAGEDYERAVVPDAARKLLSRFDERARHYEVRAEVPAAPGPEGGGG